MICKPSLTETLKAMAVGDVEVINFGLFAYATVRNVASNYGSDNGRKYSVRIDRTAETYTITRTR